MDVASLKACWQAEEKKVFVGWDFSYIEKRSFEEPLPWDYKEKVLQYIRPTQRLLDMETGGGEFLSSLRHPYKNTYATENWEPNYRLLMDTLAKQGITIVRQEEDGTLPFERDFFDIVLNRHGSFRVAELGRVLKPGGLFITEQVGGENNRALSDRLIEGFVPPYPENTLYRVRAQFEEAGFSIVSCGEYFPVLRFFDVGALVWFAKVIQWEFPGFSVETCLDKLLVLQREVEENGFVESREHRFYIIVRNQIGGE